MQSGFLGLTTDPEHSDRVQIITWDVLPEKNGEYYDNGIQYITKFNDILAAKMQLHHAIRHQLIDSNTDLYGTTLVDAVSAIESNNNLRQERVWLNPALDKSFQSSVNELVEKRTRKTKQINFFIQLIGFLGLALLAMNFFASLG